MVEALPEHLIVRLMRAIELRKMVQLLRDGDRVVDHVLAAFTNDPVSPITSNVYLARDWAQRLVPNLRIVTETQHGILYGVQAELDGEPYHCPMLARTPAIPACYVGLSALIEQLTASLDRGIDSV